jgi:hypothetical protein
MRHRDGASSGWLLVDEDCFDPFCLPYLGDDRARDLFFGDDEEPRLFGELEVVADGLSDADVVLCEENSGVASNRCLFFISF